MAERTKKLKQAQLEKVSELYRFVEFGKLAGGLFHDLMSPLTSLSLSVDNLYTQGLLADTALSKEIDIAIKSSTRMANFIKGVKKKIQKSDTEVLFNICEELNQVIEFLSSKWKPAGISIHTDIPHDLSIRGNPIMFHHIFTNLISNAIDAFEGTKIVDKAVNVIVIEKENDIKITISDNGKGIPFEIISQIFEPFFTTKSHNGGSGIGLPATRHALQKYFNGSITVESVESKGSAFTAYITKKPHDSSVNGSED